MNCDLKVLGVTLAAVFTLGAVVASAASAQQGNLTVDGPTKLTGTDTLEQPAVFQYSATQSYRCHGHYHAGEINATEESPLKSGKFIHPKITGSVGTLTITPTYSNCVANIGELQASATLTMNGCDYVLHFGVTTGLPSHYGITFDIVCPAGKEIELHVYSNAAHETSICTYKFGPQVGKAGSLIRNETSGKVTLGGTTTGIKATRSGILCGGTNTVENATLTTHALFEGRSTFEEPTHLTVTD